MGKVLKIIVGIVVIIGVIGYLVSEEDSDTSNENTTSNKSTESIDTSSDDKSQNEQSSSANIDTSSDDDKVVFSITKGEDFVESNPKRNEFNEVEGYKNQVGCQYTNSVENNTKHEVFVGVWSVATNSGFSDPEGNARFSVNGVIEPGGVRIVEGSWGFDTSPSHMIFTNEMPTEQQKSDWLSKYGCKAESGNIFILKPQYLDLKFVVFPKASGITEGDTMNFVVGSSEGMYPLKRDIR